MIKCLYIVYIDITRYLIHVQGLVQVEHTHPYWWLKYRPQNVVKKMSPHKRGHYKKYFTFGKERVAWFHLDFTLILFVNFSFWQNAILEKLYSDPNVTDNPFWIGLSLSDVTDEFVFRNEKKPSFTPWCVDSPKEIHENKCVFLRVRYVRWVNYLAW